MGALNRWLRTMSAPAYFDPDRVQNLLSMIYLQGLHWPGIESAFPDLPLVDSIRRELNGVYLYGPAKKRGETRRVDWRYAALRVNLGTAHILEGSGVLIDRAGRRHRQDWKDTVDLAKQDGLVISEVLQKTQTRFESVMTDWDSTNNE